MTELYRWNTKTAGARWHLLATTSMAALAITMASPSIASDADRPIVWIEIGGQLQRMDGGEEPFAPPFVLSSPRPEVESVSPLAIQRRPRFDNGGQLQLSLQPAGSDWVASASISYGRANRSKHVHNEQEVQLTLPHGTLATLANRDLFDATIKRKESNAIVDFRVGRDVGLGVAGTHLLAELGVRYAQFASSSAATISEVPDWQISVGPPPKYAPNIHHHFYRGAADNRRSFSGLGPSIVIGGNTRLAAIQEEQTITLDWGVDGAVLFGRQKAITSHRTTGYYKQGFGSSLPTLYKKATGDRRSHSAIVPNVGGFAGLSLRFSNAKMSLGYRADMFLGAMDGGIDTRKTYDRDFHGPFATISIGFP